MLTKKLHCLHKLYMQIRTVFSAYMNFLGIELATQFSSGKCCPDNLCERTYSLCLSALVWKSRAFQLCHLDNAWIYNVKSTRSRQKFITHFVGTRFHRKVINDKADFVILGISRINFLLMSNSLGKKKKK